MNCYGPGSQPGDTKLLGVSDQIPTAEVLKPNVSIVIPRFDVTANPKIVVMVLNTRVQGNWWEQFLDSLVNITRFDTYSIIRNKREDTK